MFGDLSKVTFMGFSMTVMAVLLVAQTVLAFDSRPKAIQGVHSPSLKGPHYPFATLQEAIFDVSEYVWRQPDHVNVEFGGWIIQDKKTGRFLYLDVSRERQRFTRSLFNIEVLIWFSACCVVS